MGQTDDVDFDRTTFVVVRAIRASSCGSKSSIVLCVCVRNLKLFKSEIVHNLNLFAI